MRADDVDIAVIGGGPAGSSLAALLTQAGYRTLLLEREFFPRPHVGESLLPGVLFALAKTGALERVERAGFTRKYGATYVWGRTREPWTIRFSEVPQDRTFTYQCDRAEFDSLLLDHARDEGVDVREGHQVTRAVMADGRVAGLSYVDAAGAAGEVRARLCVDASGQWSVLGRQLRLRQHNHDLRHVALFGHYHGGGGELPDVVAGMEPTDAGNVYVVAVDDGWLWHIPLAGNLRSIGLVTDPQRIRGLSRAQRQAFYRRTVEACKEYAPLLEGGAWAGDFEIVTDWSFICRQFHGAGYLLVGDAACFVDPILASGIALALQGVIRAAKAIRTSLETPDLHRLAMAWYQEGYLRQALDFVDMANHWYHGQRLQESWFWTAQRLVDPSQNLSLRQAFVFISSGLAQEAPEAAIRYMGGFTPGQLAVTYENLGVDAAPDAGAAAGDGAQRAAQVGPAQALASTPAFAPGAGCRAWMAETAAGLRPVARVEVPAGAGEDAREIVVSLPTLSLLNLVDGTRSGAEIAQTLAERFTGGGRADPAALRPVVGEVLAGLAAEGALILS